MEFRNDFEDEKETDTQHDHSIAATFVAAVDENINVEEITLSKVSDKTATELMKIGKKYNLKENDPCWLFADVLLTNSEISTKAAEASKIAADEAQRAVMKKFDDESEKISNALSERLTSSVNQFSLDFEKEQKKIVTELQYIAQDFETKKIGLKKTTVSVIFLSIAASTCLGYFLGSGSQIKLMNDDILLNSQNYQAVVQRYNKLSKKQRKTVDKLLFQ